MTLHAFDFDGTLTTRDTLICFIRFACGTRGLLGALLRNVHRLVLMKLGLYSNGVAKQHVFACCFKGMSEEAFDQLCKRFAEENRRLLRPQAVARLREALDAGDKVIVVSASIDRWVRPFFTDQGLSVTVVGTEVEISDGVLTGRFRGNNCYGEEKVRRISEVMPPRSDYRLIAYGDSRGDRELLAYADEAHYKPFRS